MATSTHKIKHTTTQYEVCRLCSILIFRNRIARDFPGWSKHAQWISNIPKTHQGIRLEGPWDQTLGGSVTMAEPLMGSAAPRAESLHRLGLQGFLAPSGLQTQVFVHPIDAQTS